MMKFLEVDKDNGRLLDLWRLIVISYAICFCFALTYSKYLTEYQSGYVYATVLKIPGTRYLRHHERNPVAPSRPIPVRKTTKMRFGPVYVFGAVGRNTTNHTAWDVVNVYGSLKKSFYKSFTNHSVVCCLQYGNRSDRQSTQIVQRKVLQINFHFIKPNITSFHIVCPNIHHSVGGVPFSVALSRKTIGCDENIDEYVKVEFPKREPGFKIAVGTQIAYKDINAELIIEWMETYRYLQVDKVVSYYHRSVNKDALRALTYYHNTGFVDLHEIILPEEDMIPRSFKHASAQLFNDLRLSVYDSFEKMSGYTYFGIIDFDEFLIPGGNKTIKEMLIDLQDTYARAAGFFFKTQFFYLTWGKSNNDSNLILGQFVNRTAKPPKVDRPKNLYMPVHVKQGGIRTHVFVPEQNFKRINVPAKFGFLRHFRSCRRSNSTDCVAPRDTIDTTVVEWSKLIENNVHLARKRIFEIDTH